MERGVTWGGCDMRQTQSNLKNEWPIRNRSRESQDELSENVFSSFHAIARITEAGSGVLASRGRMGAPYTTHRRSRKWVSDLVSVTDAAPLESLLHSQLELEARVGIEPTMQLLQSRALPLGYPAASHRAVSLP